ncbi:uncharacterized [Tachysurus ichikawai]
MPEVWALPTEAHASTTCYHSNKGGARWDLALALFTSSPLLPPSFSFEMSLDRSASTPQDSRRDIKAPGT